MTVPSSIAAPLAEVSGYRFDQSDLCVPQRRPGISAFMRIRNGADFLEATIRSHVDFFDEIVAVYNQCTDATPEILARLQAEFGADRLRVIHYTDRVYPQGTAGHASTASDDPSSVVNYSNFALAATRCQHVTKLDDDHLAIADTTQAVVDAIRAGRDDPQVMYCFSGLNLFRRGDGRLSILARDPISGSGDIGFFRVTPQTYFFHDRRFERFHRGGLRRRFAGFLYWHLKYLKRQMGFGNYELQENPHSRFARRKAALEKAPPRGWELNELADGRRTGWLGRLGGRFSDKLAFIAARDAALASTFAYGSVAEAICDTVAPEFARLIQQPSVPEQAEPFLCNPM